MYQILFATGTVDSTIVENEDEAFFLMKSVKAYTDETGTVHQSAAKLMVHLPIRYYENLKEKLVTPKNTRLRISVRGTIMANDKGSPYVREDEKRGLWTAFDVKTYALRVLGTIDKNDDQEDEFYMVLEGNLGRDPEMRYTPKGDAVTSFSMATNSTRYVDEKRVKETVWWRVSVWRKQAENAAQYLHKGSRLLLEGAPIFDPETGAPRIYDRNDGSQGSSFEITCFTFKLQDKKSDESNADFEGSADYRSSDEEEIPF